MESPISGMTGSSAVKCVIVIAPGTSRHWHADASLIASLARPRDPLVTRLPPQKAGPQPRGPASVEAKFQRAVALHQCGELTQAEILYREVLGQLPNHFDAVHMLGVIEAQRKNPEGAVEFIDRALRLRPDSAEALSNRGVALLELQRYAEALASYDRALQLRPDYVEALSNRGIALWRLKRHEEALADYDRALQLKPDYAEALSNRGMALGELRRHEEALASYDRALQLRPDYAEALNNRGTALRELKRHEEALADHERALQLKPDYAEALNNRGTALANLRRHEEALASYDRALQLKPDYAEALNNRGNALVSLKRTEEAVASYDRALQLKPDYAPALSNRGNALGDLRRHEDAARTFARLLEMAPDHDYALGRMFHSQLRCCNWTQYAQIGERIVQAVKEGRKADAPLTFLAVSDSAELQLRCSRTYVRDRYPPSPQPLWAGQRYQHDRIRVAYVSADFRDHAVSCLVAGLFEAHDRHRFETIALSLRPEDHGATGQRIKAAFDRFVDVTGKSDREAAALLRELEVDIAVDLMGFTADARTPILAHRGAPIQVNYLGFPATMGADYIDYIIADRFVIPEDRRTHYSEKVVYLPDSFQANDDKRKIGERIPTRQEVGLPEYGFVFCSFNNSYKINPRFFAVWMRLLRSVADSVLWLIADNVSVRDNLRAEAAKRGIDPGRLVFAPRIQYADHLARLRLADLFLDSSPFNAGTTASDALWAGVPVLTCAGEAFASRMAGSLLNAVGLPELITFCIEDYEMLAHKLAAAPALLTQIRTRLADNRANCSLFDTSRFRRHIETAYVTMWERHQRGERPESFAVSPSPIHT